MFVVKFEKRKGPGRDVPGGGERREAALGGLGRRPLIVQIRIEDVADVPVAGLTIVVGHDRFAVDNPVNQQSGSLPVPLSERVAIWISEEADTDDSRYEGIYRTVLVGDSDDQVPGQGHVSGPLQPFQLLLQPAVCFFDRYQESLDSPFLSNRGCGPRLAVRPAWCTSRCVDVAARDRLGRPPDRP